MLIKEIAEPGKRLSGEESVVLGIDFGTTNSLIGLSENKSVKIFLNEKGSPLHRSLCEPVQGFSINSVKRLLGKSKKEIESSPALFRLTRGLLAEEGGVVGLRMGGRFLSFPEIGAGIFKDLRKSAERSLGGKIKKAVVTVPAYLDDAGKGQIAACAKLAGIEIARLMAEPTAAAYAYGLQKEGEKSYLIYDFGGGTFDLSVINMREGIFRVLATGGDDRLGGDDIDSILAEYFGNKYKISDSSYLSALAKRAKEALTYSDYFAENPFVLDKNTFENLVGNILNRTIDIASELLESLENIKLDGIVLVGGSSKIPAVKTSLSKKFGIEIFSDLDPEKAVVTGAALQAENLSVRKDSVLIDVLPLSLGLELHGGLAEKIISRQTPIPISVTKEFTTGADGQTAIDFHIVQGERENASDCRSLARFSLKGLPPDNAGRVKVEVIFSVDADGILSVSAFEKSSGKSAILEVKPSYGMGKENIDSLLAEAYENAESDHKVKILKETKARADSLLFSLKRVILEAGSVFAQEEIAKIEKEIAELTKIGSSEDLAEIEKRIAISEKEIGSFISKSLDKILSKSLKGKNIEELK